MQTFRIFLKDGNRIAIPVRADGEKNIVSTPEVSALRDQGFVDLTVTINAVDSLDALKQFSKIEVSAVMKLKKKMAELKGRIYLLENRVEENSLHYYELFGFDSFPTKSEWKVRYREMAKIFHTDRGCIDDDNFMKLINRAKEYLDRKTID